MGKRFVLFSAAACRTWSCEALRLRKSLLARRVRGWPRGVPDWRVASSGPACEGWRHDFAPVSSGPTGRNSRVTRNFYSGARAHEESRSAGCDHDKRAIIARHGCEQRSAVCINDLGHATLKFRFVWNTHVGGYKIDASVDDIVLLPRGSSSIGSSESRAGAFITSAKRTVTTDRNGSRRDRLWTPVLSASGRQQPGWRTRPFGV